MPPKSSVPPPPTNPAVEEIVEACRGGDEEGVNTLLALGSKLDVVSSAGLTPLVAAAEFGSVALCATLLKHGASPNFVAGATGNYPLRAAITGGDGECILALVRGDADVNQESARGTPLSTAASQGDVSTISLLVKSGANVDYELRDGMTALMLAAREDQREAVKALLQAGADPNRKGSNGDGGSAADLAQAAGLQEVYGLLMQRSIVAAADSVLEGSERRQAEAKREREETAAKAREDLKAEMTGARSEAASKISSINAESSELLARLGLTKKQ
ncbi:hypothetical protein FOA52_010863 [Chlamydomonas sp. UWO 241]|nr:hypothetical protein FOA52_010863 [Chlamydomonas sp. UWO 241]